MIGLLSSLTAAVILLVVLVTIAVRVHHADGHIPPAPIPAWPHTEHLALADWERRFCADAPDHCAALRYDAHREVRALADAGATTSPRGAHA